jgi:maltooligosyltrehalose trehalohydrolase
MQTFRVWAPGKATVELLVESGSAGTSQQRVAMRAGTDGWWEVQALAEEGTRYRYSLDGGPARPDPRSPWQPEGIDGPSAVVKHGAFAWTDTHWRGARLASSVLYEMHVGTFSPEGTFDGAIERLEHLSNLGVTAVELLPVAEASGDRGWGYDGVLLWAPHHAYGGPAGLKRFVDAAHARGIAVVLDVVYNHLGPAGNYLAEFGPYFTDRYQTPWGSAVNVDGPDSQEVRNFIIGNALMWLGDYHLDGLRLDAVHAIVDEGALHWLEELSIAVDHLADQLGRTLWLIAESDRNDPRLVRPREAHGYGLTASWSDDFHHTLHTVLTGEREGYYEDYGTIAQVARALREVYVFARDWSPFRRRRHGRAVGELAGTSFLGYLQNHDQVGNRATGERAGALMSPGRLRIGSALYLLAPFVPMIFQGEEWDSSSPFQYFTDHHDPELGRAVSEGRTHEFEAFGWSPEDVPDPQDVATFERSKLNWGEVDRPGHAEVLTWYRELIALRRTQPDLAGGDLQAVETAFDEEARWLTMRRGSVAVAVNLGATAQLVPLVGAGEILLASAPLTALASGGDGVHLPPDAVAVLLRP